MFCTSGKIARQKIFIYIPFMVFIYFGASGMIVPISIVWSNGPVDNRIYGELLAKYVIHGEVNYEGFKREEAKLDQYLKILEEVKPDDLSRNEQFAFYINAYNAWTIKLILSAYPGIQSIKELGNIFKSPWEKKICHINGRVITLDDIEHKILRPRFRDPRVHFAVNCASKSCPPLRSEPYRGDVLDMQLNEMVTAFINDSSKNRLEDNTLYVSRIFKWYAEDFDHDIIGFFLKYAKSDLKRRLEERKDRIHIRYLKYDWSLNGR